jgi:hypothetical protein
MLVKVLRRKNGKSGKFQQWRTGAYADILGQVAGEIRRQQ